MKSNRAPIDVAVLNAIAASAGDLALAMGIMSCTGLGHPIKVSDRIEVTKTTSAAGTASVKTADMGGITLAPLTLYRLTVETPDAEVYGGPEPDPLLKTRTYSFYSGAVAMTGAQVAQKFVDLINADPFSRITAALVSTDQVRGTLDNVNDGDFFFSGYPAGTVLATTTPYVAPAGTPTIVNELAPGQGLAAAYTTWKITYNKLYPIKGFGYDLMGYKEVDAYIFANEADADFGDFETELDAILDGTHTPTSDYL